ncbi:MAG: exopolysaccharide biosynthesis polyprenyl glycosylphosphotransferase [Flavobacteriaceae bacterium]|nr:exopolysaccharide biosynthesis polyprenyl glycosylphosphotransferase [Flavobacteriaceae bacterium]
MLAYTFTMWSFVNELFIALWFIISIYFKSHVIGRDIKKSKLFKSSLKCLFFFSGLASILNLLFFSFQFNLSTIIIAATLFYFLMLLYRLTVDSILEKYRATGGNALNCLIIGYNSHGIELYNEMLKFPELGYRSNGVYTFNKKNKLSSFPYCGKFIDLSDNELSQFDRIFFSDKIKLKSQEKIIQKADKLNIKVSYIPELAFHDFKNFFISKISTVPYVSINNLPLDSKINLFLKRTFDFTFSLFVIIFILSWMIPIFGIIIKISSKGPVLFIQKREGYKGKVFNCVKFRTMVVNKFSDSIMADDNDARLTKFGKFLRLSTLDEMPQFLNVFIGDMSIVGPRPHPIKLNQDFREKIFNFDKRHRFKPGITGLAQSLGYSGFISSLNDMNNRVKMDIFYFKNWSIFFDLKIVLNTFFILLRGVFSKL